MQRILSVEASRNANHQTNSEFVTKRFCCSFLLTIAFFAVLGGFLLGKFVSDRTLDDMLREINDLKKSISILNGNFQKINDTLLLSSLSPYYHHHYCNFSLIGNNETGLLRASDYLKNLNNCFKYG